MQAQRLPVSKTQRKREATALQELGKRLTRLTGKQLALIPISTELRTAIIEFQRLPDRYGAKRRQLQFIGRLMRDCDHEQVLSALHSPALHPLEQGLAPSEGSDPVKQCLQSIMDHGFIAIEEIVYNYPQADRQKLKQLHRNIEKFADDESDRKMSQITKLKNYLASLIH